MAFLDGCWFVAGSAGEADFADGIAQQGFRNLAGAGAVDAAVYSYRAESLDRTEWELGVGAYDDEGTLARTTIYASSDAGAKVDFTAPPLVAIVALSADLGGFQPLDADLTAIAGLSAAGLVARTGAGTAAARTIAGTSGKISVTNGDGGAGNPTITAGADIADLTAEDQVLTGGARVTSKSLGTVTTGTLTPDPGDRALQHYTNNGAHTLAPGSNTGSYMLDITNGASAGAITTSGWTRVAGDDFTTTNSHHFRCHCSIGQAGSLLIIQALQ